MKLNKLSIKTKQTIKEVLIIAIILLITVVSILADCSIIQPPTLMLSKINDVENLFFTLFTVQASVSTVSIAIVSIINGLVNDYVLGISISRFIMHLKPVILKHGRLIMANLIICILNYFCLSYCFFNVCIALFVTSIIITVLMIKEIYIIFMGKTVVRQEIHRYVYENYDSSILNDLNTELLSAIETGNSSVIQEDYNAIKVIFKKEVEKNRFQKTDIIDQLSSIICDAFEKTSYKHNGQKNNQCLLLVCDVYKIANQQENSPLHLDIWNRIIEDFLRSLNDISYEQLKKDYAYYILHDELYKNLNGRTNEEIRNSPLKYYSVWVYSRLLSDDSNLNNDEKNLIKKTIYEMPSLSLHYNHFDSSKEYIEELLICELCNLHRAMIDKGDNAGIKKLFFDHIRFETNNFDHVVVYIITMIYLYYLSSREALINKKPLQHNALRIIKENHEQNAYFYYNIDLLKIAKEKLSFIKTLMHNWEYMNELEAKWLITDYVVEDFFIFTSLDKFWENNVLSEMVSILAPDTMFPLYSRYFSNDNRDSFVKLYTDFEKLFNKEKSESNVNEKISLLNDVFNERYKSETIKQGELEKISDDDITKFSNILISKIQEVNDTELSAFGFKYPENDGKIIEDDNTIVYVDVISSCFFQHNSSEKYLQDNIITQTITSFIKSILKNIAFEKISYTQKNKQQKLINMIEESEIIPTVAIGNRDEFWDEEESDILKKYTAKMKKIKYPGGYNYFFILDSELIEFSMTNLRVEFVDLSWEEIKHRCKENENGKWSFNVTNDIYIPFDKSEIEKYITNTKKKVLVYADIKMRLKSDKVGAGIQIVSE